MSLDPFLKRLAQALADRHRHELDAVAVVLPGRRAGLYLRKYLAEVIGTTTWSPELLDVGSFMERLTGLRQAGSMELLFLLHQAQTDLFKERADTLAEFLHWAPVSLRDMSEADAHLLDLDALYRTLREYHEIEEWSFRLGELSPGQQRLEAQWRSTGVLHRALLTRMAARGVGTSGSLARAAAEGLAAGTLSCPWKAVWFAGLNALEPATTAVVRHLQDHGLATVAWDADVHYLAHPEQEAGVFLRRSMEDLGPGLLPAVDAIARLPRTFHAVAVPDALSQVFHAAQYLAELDPAERANTAVVLADEQLLMPLLEALPADIGPVNVTMGMGLETLPVHGLTEAFLGLHAGARNDAAFRLADVERLLLHPFLHQGHITEDAIARLRATGRMHLGASDVVPATNALTGHEALTTVLLPLHNDSAGLRGPLNALLGWASTLQANDRFVQEQLFRMARLQRRLHNELERSGHPAPDLRTYIELRRRLMREERITFFGEPLSGLQIMGFLETRTIDHRRVLLLGAQEGSLPRTGFQQSWIPHDIRRIHRLPLASDTEAVTAYHFQRLMQQAQEVQVVHGGEGSEPSRFIAQWLHEVVDKGTTRGGSMTRMATFPARHKPAISVEKTPAVMQRLAEIAGRGFSPSALGTYLRCPLDFWFQYGLRIRAANEVDGRLAGDVLGDAVHQVLEDIHRPWLGRALRPAELREAARGVHHLLRDHLLLKFPANTLDRGHFRLRMDMAAHAMANFLMAEAERCGDTESIILGLEVEVAGQIAPGITLRGRCDRIELRNGELHVWDMKTGKVKEDLLHIKALDRAQLTEKKQQALQLLVYGCAYLLGEPDVSSVKAGIIPLQKQSRSEGLMLKVAGRNDLHRDQLPAITNMLADLAGELMDPERPFAHIPSSTYCASCVA